VIPAASSGASSPLSVAGSAGVRMADMGMMVEDDPSPRSSSVTCQALTVALVKPGRGAPAGFRQRTLPGPTVRRRWHSSKKGVGPPKGARTGYCRPAGYVSPTLLRVAPGQIITVFAAGVGSTLTQPVFAGAGNLPTSLAGIGDDRAGDRYPSADPGSEPAAITIQIPYGLWMGCSLSNAARAPLFC